MKIQFILLTFLVCLSDAQSQDIREVSKSIVKINVSITQHSWIDDKTYQFLKIEVRGLPDLNFGSSAFINDGLPNIDLNEMGGRFDVPFVISKKNTFQPVYYDLRYEKNTSTKPVESVYTCLFLVDDFNKVRVKDLLLASNGVFGHPERSMAYFKSYVTRLDLESQDLKPNKETPIANSRWYKSQTANLPDDNTFRRHHLQVHDHPYLKEHTKYEVYLKKVFPRD